LFVEDAWLQPDSECHVGRRPSLSNQERDLIGAALAKSHGRVSGPHGAATKLGIPRTTLDSRIKSLRINKNRYRPDAGEFSPNL
jgi:formate hydrogenlyase transcriptional activator